MFNSFMKWLVPKLETWCRKHNRVINIHGTDAPEDIYLIRYVLFRSKLFSIYIHRFLRSDRDDCHDHPFDFLSYVVTKGYWEQRIIGGEKIGKFLFNSKDDGSYRDPGSWAFRKAEAIHMVKLKQEYRPAEQLQAPLTIIFRGPYRREWGFWKEAKATKHSCAYYFWTKWTEYLGVPDSDKRE